MDLDDPASYRPISNLRFLSKVVEKVVDGRLSEHIKRHCLFPTERSAERELAGRRGKVVEIGWSAERLFRRSRSAHAPLTCSARWTCVSAKIRPTSTTRPKVNHFLLKLQVEVRGIASVF